MMSFTGKCALPYGYLWLCCWCDKAMQNQWTDIKHEFTYHGHSPPSFPVPFTLYLYIVLCIFAAIYLLCRSTWIFRESKKLIYIFRLNSVLNLINRKTVGKFSRNFGLLTCKLGDIIVKEIPNHFKHGHVA